MVTTPTPKAPQISRYATSGSPRYAVALALMAAVLILSNIGASKGVEIGPFVLDGGFFLFPVAYIVGDVISEVYGFKASRLAILTAFALSAFSSICFWVMIALPSASFYEGQAAFAQTLGSVPQIVLASLAGFLVGQLSNAWIMSAMKRRSGEKLLWVRLMSSTGVGEFLDTLIFCSIAASVIGIQNPGQFINYVLFGFAYKTLMEYLLVPITAWIIGSVKRAEPSYTEH